MRNPSRIIGCIFMIGVLFVACSEVPREDAARARQIAVQRAVDNFLASHDVPGVSVAVIAEGEAITAVGGLEDVARKRPVTPRTIFRIASTTKLYISALAMKLVESGTLDLNDPLRRWVQDPPPRLGAARNATLEQLLSHTSGLPQTFTRDEDRGRPLGADDLLDRIPPPICEPGECWVYGDGNYILAGLMIESATGQTLNAALTERLLRPLRLDDTLTTSETPPDPVIAPQYRLRVDEQHRPVDPVEYLTTDFPRWKIAGTIATTAIDLADWGAALFGGRVVTEQSLDRMVDTSVSRGLPCPEECVFPYGLGVFHYEESGRTMLGHDGSSGTVLAHDPTDGLTIALLTNGGDQNMGALLKAVVQALE